MTVTINVFIAHYVLAHIVLCKLFRLVCQYIFKVFLIILRRKNGLMSFLSSKLLVFTRFYSIWLAL